MNPLQMGHGISQEKGKIVAGFLFLILSVLGFWIPIKLGWTNSLWKIVFFIFATIWGLLALRVVVTLFTRKS